MQPDKLRRLARLIEDGLLTLDERRQWAEELREHARALDEAMAELIDEALVRLG
jgi:hypothetical protein